ncbi:TPM domain-containing protein [Kosakonia oryzendophytica]|uniref:TPM domain-containing protein n=1 Tax=Kosakonia oryzendophytica TaxID=1005665 RepID=UPI003D331AD7
MARILALLLVLTGFAAQALASPIPPMNGFVNDPDELLTSWERAELTRQVNTLNERSGTQTAVLVVPGTGSDTIEQFAWQVFNHWRLGNAQRNDGVLLLVAWQDRHVRIEVGSGLEGMLTDALASRIINEYIIPPFKSGELATGITRGVEGISTVLASQPLPKAEPPTFWQEISAYFSLWKSLLALALVIIYLTITGRLRLLAVLFVVACPLTLILLFFSDQSPWLMPYVWFSGSIPVAILIMVLGVLFIYPQRLSAAGRQKYRESRQSNHLSSAATVWTSTDSTHYSSSDSTSHSSSDSSSSGGDGGSSDGGGSSGNW